MRLLTLIISLLVVAAAIGCGPVGEDFMTDARKENGLIVILPGIEGEGPMNHDIRRGLVNAGLYRALPIYNWGRPIPIAGPLINQMDVLGNRLAAKNVANLVVQYQDAYPGRPVYLIGHSGGGGVAVFAAESLPRGRKVEALVLLSASISTGYDLTRAIENTRLGIVNFYSHADVGLLVVGTTLAGNVDGVRGPAAGAIGFNWPEGASGGKLKAYQRLYQVQMTQEMTGGIDAHSASTKNAFVRRYVAPWMTSAWPAGYSSHHPVR